MAVVNLQTLNAYATLQDAIDALPAAPWGTGYTLRFDDDATYTGAGTHVAIMQGVNALDPGYVDPAGPTGLTPLVVEGVEGLVPTINGEAARGGILINGLSYVTLRFLHFTGAVQTSAGVELGDGAASTTNISVDRCVFGEFDPPNGLAGHGILADAVTVLVIGYCQFYGPGMTSQNAAMRLVNGGVYRIYAPLFLLSESTYAIEIVGSADASIYTAWVNGGAEGGLLFVEGSGNVYAENLIGIHMNRSGLADSLVHIENSDGVILQHSTLVDVNIIGNTPQVVRFDSNLGPTSVYNSILVMEGTSRACFGFAFAADRDLYLGGGNLFYPIPGEFPAFVGAVDAGPTYATLVDWNSATAQDALAAAPNTEGSVEADPLFTNIVFPDSHITFPVNSPARDIALASFVTVDGNFFAPTPRPQGARSDAGAYELLITATIVTTAVEHDGGYTIELTGASVPDGTYSAHVGPLGTREDPIAYPVTRGNGVLVELVGGAVQIVSPPGAAGVQTVTLSDGVIDYALGTIEYERKTYRSSTYSLRGLLLSWLYTGPTRVGREPLP